MQALDAVTALAEALVYLQDDVVDPALFVDRDKAFDYVAAQAGPIIDRLYTERDLLRNIARSGHHALEYITRPVDLAHCADRTAYSALFAAFIKFDHFQPSLIEACPRLINVVTRYAAPHRRH